jgi:hypothetical protein
MRHILAVFIITTLFTGLVVGDQSEETEKPAAKNDEAQHFPEARLRSVSVVLSDLRREAQVAIFKKGYWLRDESDYAQDKNVTINNPEIVKALGRRLNQNPAIDGYCRWQLLSFGPQFKVADVDAETEAAMWKRLVAVMPRFVYPPEPVIPNKPKQSVSVSFSGIQRAFLSDRVPIPRARGSRPVLSVVNNGVGLTTNEAQRNYELGKSCEKSADRLSELREIVAHANIPVRRYRDHLIERLPAEDGVRFAAMIKDASDRVAAGDDSGAMATERLMRESEWIKNERNLSPTRIRELEKEIRGLHRIYRDVPVDIYARDGRVLVKKYSVDFSSTRLKRILANLEAARAKPQK